MGYQCYVYVGVVWIWCYVIVLFKVCYQEVVVGGVDFGVDFFVFQVFQGIDVVFIFMNQDVKVGIVVWVREIDDLFLFFGDGDVGDGNVDVVGLQGGDDVVEIYGVEIDVKVGMFVNFVDNFYVEIDYFIGFLIYYFEWYKVWVGDNVQGFCVCGFGGYSECQVSVNCFQLFSVYVFFFCYFWCFYCLVRQVGKYGLWL